MAWRTIQDEVADINQPAQVAVPVWLAQNGAEQFDALQPSGEIAYLDGTEPTWSSHPDQPGGFWLRLPYIGGAGELSMSILYSTATATGGTFIVRCNGAVVEAAAAGGTYAAVDVTLPVSALAPTVVSVWVGWRSDIGDPVPDANLDIKYGVGTEVYYNQSVGYTPLVGGKSHYFLELPDMQGSYTATRPGGQRRYHVCRNVPIGGDPDLKGVLQVWPPLEASPALIPTSDNSKVATPLAFAELGVCILHGLGWAWRVTDPYTMTPQASSNQAMTPDVAPRIVSQISNVAYKGLAYTPQPINAPQGFCFRGTGTQNFLFHAMKDTAGVTLEMSVYSLTNDPAPFTFSLTVVDLDTNTIIGFATTDRPAQIPAPSAIPPVGGYNGNLDVTQLMPYNIRSTPSEWGAADSVWYGDMDGPWQELSTIQLSTAAPMVTGTNYGISVDVVSALTSPGVWIASLSILVVE